MSLGKEYLAETAYNPVSDVEEVIGTYDEVVKRCDELAKMGYKYSRGGYIQLADGRYIRTMYLFNEGM
jgi:hypothetical protein